MLLFTKQHARDTGKKYQVSVINPQSKGDFMDMTWHNMNKKFDSVVQPYLAVLISRLVI